ncbi:MAG: glycosyltransferase family 2 protein [Brachybacterium sp.]|nr:glycosyltransferase family 2 protein [Brachybacterium sp.]
MHTAVAEAMSAAAELLPIEDAETAARRTASSRFVVSTRFHPVVFGLAAGSAVLPLALDRYGDSRMRGAAENAGMTDAVVPFSALADPQARTQIVDLLARYADAEPAPLRARQAERREERERWWDRVHRVLTDKAPAEGETPWQPEARPRWDGALRRLAPLHLSPTSDGSPASPARVAVIMRTRDRLVMLDRAVQDVLAQTRTDVQLVIVEDGGDAAGVEAILDRYRHDLGDRLTVVHTGESRGMEAASNIGLANSRSEYVVVHDDDDTWHPRFLEETVAHLDTHPEEAAVAARTMIVLERDIDGALVEYERFPFWEEMQGIRLLDLLQVNRMVPISLLYRRAVHEQIGPFDERRPVVGDYAFHLRLLTAHRVGFLEEPLAFWHQRPEATGSEGNSVFAREQAHRHHDLELREEHLRTWVDSHGIGLPLYLTKVMEQEADRTIETLRAEIAGLQERIGRLEDAAAGERPRSSEGPATRATGGLRRQAGRARRAARRLLDS